MAMSDTLKNAMDTQRKIELANETTIDDVFAKLNGNADVTAIAEPKLKKCLFGKSIVFPTKARVTVKVTAKKNTVTVQKITTQSGMSVGGVTLPTGAGKIDEGSAYFKSLADAITAALK